MKAEKIILTPEKIATLVGMIKEMTNGHNVEKVEKFVLEALAMDKESDLPENKEEPEELTFDGLKDEFWESDFCSDEEAELMQRWINFSTTEELLKELYKEIETYSIDEETANNWKKQVIRKMAKLM